MERPGSAACGASGAVPRQREAALRAISRRAREAQVLGDVVEMENCYQHAEHYFRVMRGQGHERRG